MPVEIATLLTFLVTAGCCAAAGFAAAAPAARALARLEDGARTQTATAGGPQVPWKDMLTRAAKLAAEAADPRGLRRVLLRAGCYEPQAVEWYRGAQVVCGLVLAVAAVVIAAGHGASPTSLLAEVMGAALLGFRIPAIYLARRRKRRVRELERTLPNAVDLLIVSVESGLGIDQALRLVARELGDAHPEISRELVLVHSEISAGKARAEAMRAMSDRTGIDEVRDLVSALVQADRFGTSICQTLRTRSEFMRVQSRQRAEEKAAKLGVKLIFPIFFFVLPTLFLVTLGPAIFQLIKELVPVINNM